MRVVTCVLNGELSSLKDWIVTSGYIFICLFCIMGGLFFLGLSLFHLFMVYYYAFVNDNRVIHVAVDENDVIQDTFLELSNGKIIPIKITKLKMDKPKEKEATGE
jgi:hypothetical protein